jgi:SAM-dependent methyltransferase
MLRVLKRLKGAVGRTRRDATERRLLLRHMLDYATDRLILDPVTDRRLGIATRGFKNVAVEGHVNYGTIPYRGTMAMLRALQGVAGKVMVDIGCGKGRFLCCAAQFPFAKVVGVECDEELLSQGRRNVSTLRHKCCEIDIVSCLAEEYSYEAGAFYYLFNPFSAQILERVVARIGRERTGPVVLVYSNPLHDDVLQHFPWLERYDSWGRGRHGLWCEVSFWRSRND